MKSHEIKKVCCGHLCITQRAPLQAAHLTGHCNPSLLRGSRVPRGDQSKSQNTANVYWLYYTNLAKNKINLIIAEKGVTQQGIELGSLKSQVSTLTPLSHAPVAKETRNHEECSGVNAQCLCTMHVVPLPKT